MNCARASRRYREHSSSVRCLMRLHMKRFKNICHRNQHSSQHHGFHALGNQRGAFMVTMAFSLLTMLGFIALGIEVGRWYVVRAELSKAVDAAALVGAKNISNPYVNAETLMTQVGQANFKPGLFGTDGTVQITGTIGEQGKVYVTASANVLNQIAQAFAGEPPVGQENPLTTTGVSAFGAAQQRDVEIVMVLDESGSMAGQPIEDLKVAAKSFLDFFTQTQANDKFALIAFASGVEVKFPLGPNFVQPMKAAIDSLVASGGTNTEDALDQADGPYGFTDQTGVPGDERVQQFLIFFSDGNPTAFRGMFTRNGVDYDAVGYAADWNIRLMKPDEQFTYLNVYQYRTGDGLPKSSTSCQSGSPPKGYYNTKWWVLEDPVYGVSGYSEFLDVYYVDLLNTSDPEQCNISKWRMKNYAEAITKQMAIDHAAELKAKGVKIYTIGLGNVDQEFLSAIASGPAFEYYTPDSAELEALFQKIATNIKLRLIQ
ncbi:MAG: VWA domain-containing protein [Nitrospirae bacterium]|nr:MAG: VWA domain-containing protein [Nitrospirota bacterium]